LAKQKQYKLKDSDRSGFTYKEIELTKDGVLLVGPGEFDAPPPSNKSTGGEGEFDRSGVRVNWDTTTAVNTRPIQYVTAGIGITFPTVPDSQSKTDPNNSWVYVAGSSSTIDISINPQISAGRQNSIITIQCISNNIILENSNGLVLRSIFNMDSGAIINLIYNATDNLWHETSRMHELRSIEG